MLELNKIYNGDCLEILKDIPDNSIDAVVTDPPYEFVNKNPIGGGFMDKKNKRYLHNIDDTFGMTFNPIDYLEIVKKKMKIMNQYVFTNKNLLATYIQYAIENNYSYDVLLWLKPNPVPCCNGHYLSDKEYCVFIRGKGACFNKGLDYSKYFTYYRYSVGTKVTKHPTEKPLSIIQNMIEVSSKQGDIILDPYMGSGTTGVACKNLGRNFIGIELDKGYFDIAKNRIECFIEKSNVAFSQLELDI